MTSNFSKNIADVETAKTRYSKGLDQLRSPWLFPIRSEDIQERKNILKDVSSMTQLAALVSPVFSPPQTSQSFKGVQPLKGPAEDHICFDFDASPTGWYFMYGKTKTYRFTLMIFRTALSPVEHNSSQVLYSVVGGFDGGNGWVSFPQNSGFATYNCPSSGDISIKYLYQPPGENSLNLGLTITKSVHRVMTGTITYKSYTLKFVLTSTEAGKYNGPKGCVPICFAGLGTSYWSYTNMKSTITIANTKETGGIGWFDHQWINGGIPHGFFPQILYAFVQGGKPSPKLKWLWLTIQLTTGVQYIISIPLKDKDLPLKVGDKFSTRGINKYNKTTLNYSIPGNITVLAIQTVSFNDKYDMAFPTKYKIIIEGSTFILSAPNSLDIVTMPFGGINWEGPGNVTDTKGNSIGSGFLEANNLLPDSLSGSLILAINNLNANISDSPLSNRGVWIGVILILIVLTLIILFIYMIVHLVRKKKKRSRRSRRRN